MSQIEKLIQKMKKKPTPTDITMQEFKLYVENYGYKLDRVKGSHHVFFNDKYNQILVVPIVGGKYVKSAYDQANSQIKDMEEKENEE